MDIDGGPLQDQLVSAILAGNSVVVPKGETSGGSFSEVPLCESADQTGCVISYATYRDNLAPGGEGQLDAYLSNIGEIFQAVAPMPVWSSAAPEITTPFVKLPGLLSGRCVNDGTYHYLEVSIAADPSDPRTDEIRGDVLLNGEANAPWGLHLIDMTLAMGNLVEIVGTQAEAYAGR